MPGPSDTSRPPMLPGRNGTGHTPAAALSGLAARFDSRDFMTVLTTGHGRVPHLAVAYRKLRLTEDIYAQDGWYWWGWAERIAPVCDPVTAAHEIISRLRATAGPGDG